MSERMPMRLARALSALASALAAFAVRPRGETDLGRIGASLLAAVEEAMQPAHVSLWLRPPDRKG